MAKTILLADDSVTIQKVVELTFMDEDYEVVAVSDGGEAVRRFAEVAPALVIADVHMPVANGYEVCRQVKQTSPATPVLLLVGTFEPFDDAKAAEVGADGHLKKPFDSQDLLSRVAALIGTGASPSLTSTVALEEPSPFDDAMSPFELEPVAPEPVVEAGDPFPSFDLEPEVAERGVETQQQVAFNLGGLDAAPIETELFEPVLEPVEEAPLPAAPPPRTELPRLSIPTQPSPPVVAAPVAPAAAPVAAPASNGHGELSDADVERIARRVADLVAEKIVRDVAWEVIPDLAEIAIRERIQELESEIE